MRDGVKEGVSGGLCDAPEPAPHSAIKSSSDKRLPRAEMMSEVLLAFLVSRPLSRTDKHDKDSCAPTVVWGGKESRTAQWPRNLQGFNKFPIQASDL